MTSSTHTISPLRQRMLDDMRMRKLSPTTQASYIRVVKRFAGFLGRSPDTASAEDLRRYQLYWVAHGMLSMSLNATLTGRKLLFATTLDHPELLTKMRAVPVPHKLPVVLSRDEVARLLAAVDNLKHQTALAVAYGAGLRASEVASLKISGWLFPGLDPIDPLSTRQLNRAVHAAAEAAGIDKRGLDAYAEAQLCHAFAGTEGGYSDYPGAARSPETGDHGAVCSGGHRYSA